MRLFDGLFRSSDNILRNVLVGIDSKSLISIDEGDIFGKRLRIFNKNDWSKKNLDEDMLFGCLGELDEDKENRMKIIEERLMTFGFSKNIEEFKNRYMNYRAIVLEELK